MLAGEVGQVVEGNIPVDQLHLLPVLGVTGQAGQVRAECLAPQLAQLADPVEPACPDLQQPRLRGGVRDAVSVSQQRAHR